MLSNYAEGISKWLEIFVSNMEAVNIIPHFTISFLILSGSNVNINKVLNVYVVFPAVFLYIPIFKVIKTG